MTNEQLEEIAEHMRENITWPATKQQIVDACKGHSHTSEEVQADIRDNLAERTYNTAEGVRMALVK